MTVENRFAGLTIKEILTRELGLSKRAITALKAREDGIMLNGRHATVRAVVGEGDILSLKLEDEGTEGGKLIPSSVMPDIIYEDGSIIALNKPSGMPTHQSQGHFYDTLANSLAYYYEKQERPFVFRSVNRLDRNTSGIVLVSKDRLSAARLSEQMKNDGIKKTYIAILEGHLPHSEGTVSTYIRRRDQSIILREVCGEDEGGRLAVTHYKVLAASEELSLVLATLETGRTHQLRVHFSHMGAQILGDDLYGKPSDLIDRHALHARTLRFAHPITGEETELRAPIPDDMLNIIEKHFGKEFI